MIDSLSKLVKTPIFLSDGGEEFAAAISNSLISNYSKNGEKIEIKCEQAKTFLDDIDLIMFDCDGVLWRGDVLLPETSKVLDELQKRGKKLVYVTNNSTRSRKGFLEKMRRLGLGDKIVENEECILNSSYAAAEYLKSKNFHLTDKIVYVVGEEGIMDELKIAGISSIGGLQHAHKEIETKRGMKLEIDKRVGAVVVGLDRYINYYKLQYAQLCINELNAEFIATNTDAAAHLTENQEWAGAGSMVNAVIGCTHVNPVVVGKPSLNLIELLSRKYGVSREKIAMIGDRLDTDIKFAQNCKVKSILTLTGVTTIEKLFDKKNEIYPDYFINSLSDLI